MDKIIQVESFKMDLKEIEKILNKLLDKKIKLKNISYYEADIKITEDASFLHLKFYNNKNFYSPLYNIIIELPLLLIISEYYKFYYNKLDDIYKNISLIEAIKILKLKEKIEKSKIEFENIEIKPYVFEIIREVKNIDKIYITYNKDIEKENIKVLEKNIFIENKNIWINIRTFENVNKDIVLSILEKHNKEVVINNI